MLVGGGGSQAIEEVNCIGGGECDSYEWSGIIWAYLVQCDVIGARSL